MEISWQADLAGETIVGVAPRGDVIVVASKSGLRRSHDNGSSFHQLDSHEVRGRFVRLVQPHTAEHGSRWAAMAAIAPKAGCTTKRSGVGYARPNATPASEPARRLTSAQS
jgi:hypothetical protein